MISDSASAQARVRRLKPLIRECACQDGSKDRQKSSMMARRVREVHSWLEAPFGYALGFSTHSVAESGSGSNNHRQIGNRRARCVRPAG